jgi:tetratricopeptide (TPR) repeat protein
MTLRTFLAFLRKLVFSLRKPIVFLIAALITWSLYSTNTAPFSFLKAEEEEPSPAAAEASPAPVSNAPEQSGPSLIAIQLDPLDTPVEEGQKSWVKTIDLVNSSNRTITAHVWVYGDRVSSCDGKDEAECVVFPTEVTIEKNDVQPVRIRYTGPIDPADDPITGKVHIVGGGLQQEYPFSIDAKTSETWQIRWSQFKESARAKWAEWALLGALLLLVGYILYQVFYWKVSPVLFPQEFNIVKMDIGDDDATKPLWPLFSSRIREMQEMGNSIVNPQPMGDEIDLPTNIGKEGELVKTVLELVSWVLPRRYLTIRLQSLTAPKKGKGISVSLVQGENKEVIAERVFWSQEYSLDDKAVDVEHLLMVPVVIWMSYAYKKHYKKDFEVYDVPGENWESLAHGMVATELWKLGSPLAKKLYLEALYHDPNNRLAQNGLGRVWIEESQGDSVEALEQRERLELAIAYLEAVRRIEVKDLEEYTVRFAAMYNLGSARLLLRQHGRALEVCDALLSELMSIMAESSREKREDLLRWLDRCRTMTILLRYGVLLEKEPLADLDGLENHIGSLLNDLMNAMDNPPSDRQMRLLVNLNYRTQYNAACFFSQCYELAKGLLEKEEAEEQKEKIAKKAKEYAELAFDYLRLALGHGGTLIEYAHKDASLKPLRTGFEDTFNTIAKKTEVKEEEESKKETTESTTRLVWEDSPKDQIHLLPGMTEEIEEAFHQLSIYTWSDLLLNGVDPNSREALRKKTKLEPEQLSWWLNLCDLTRVPGLSLESAVLLESKGAVDTIKDLKDREAETLSQTLGKRISAAQLGKWIASAKELIPSLEYQKSNP